MFHLADPGSKNHRFQIFVYTGNDFLNLQRIFILCEMND
jgi:hypothetical protein